MGSRLPRRRPRRTLGVGLGTAGAGDGVAGGLVPAGGTVLDVGCGAGVEAIFMASLGFEVIGVDRSEAGLEIARERAKTAGVGVEWRLGDALALPVETESIDLALDRGCFHVIARKDAGPTRARSPESCAPAASSCCAAPRKTARRRATCGWMPRRSTAGSSPRGSSAARWCRSRSWRGRGFWRGTW
ncbi:MAG: class I SAM-dependent methyltransferase [Thermoanaerobaculia bacterium]|nr:class I SAM-dependent methyltransferase [Thermoanaerobaculia bacterium]